MIDIAIIIRMIFFALTDSALLIHLCQGQTYSIPVSLSSMSSKLSPSWVKLGVISWNVMMMHPPEKSYTLGVTMEQKQ